MKERDLLCIVAADFNLNMLPINGLVIYLLAQDWI